MSKIAVSIGVSNASGQTELPGAAPSARKFADWARGQGFDVLEFNDLDGKVRSQSLIAAFTELVERRGTEQLMVFFAGHGMASGPDEDYWFLSDGLADLVDASASILRARNIAKLRHVVFFADACRTAAASDHLHAGRGSPAFIPYKEAGNRIATVDIFNSTITGRSALEALHRADDGKIIAANGIFTEALQSALNGEVARVIDVKRPSGSRVIYAHKLKPYLEETVRRESSRRVRWTQNPDCRPVSGDELVLVELGQVDVTNLKVMASHPDGSRADGSRITILDVMARPEPSEVHTGPGPEIELELPLGIYGVRAELPDHLQRPSAPEPLAYLNGPHDPVEVLLSPSTSLARDSGGEPEPQPLLLDRYVVDLQGHRFDRPPERGVFTVVNEDVLTGRMRSELRPLESNAEPVLREGLVADQEAEHQLYEMAEAPARDHYETMTGVSITGRAIQEVRGHHQGWDEEGDYWYVRGGEPGASVTVLLDSGGWAGLPLFFGFVGEAIAGEEGIESLRYRPAPGGPYDWDDWMDQTDARRLLMAAEAAARVDRFHIFGENAVGLAREMRMFKHQNPMLGIYAAYAYAEAGRIDAIANMIGFYTDRGQAVPFDIALLSGRSIGAILGETEVFPAFPILRRGWAHLGADGSIPEALARARAQLTPAMFTTVESPAGEMLGEAIEQGDLW